MDSTHRKDELSDARKSPSFFFSGGNLGLTSLLLSSHDPNAKKMEELMGASRKFFLFLVVISASLLRF